MSSSTTPARIVDAHHHFYDPPGKHFHAFLNSLGVPAYMPEAYAAESASLPVTHSVRACASFELAPHGPCQHPRSLGTPADA